MPFDQSTITSVEPPFWDGSALQVSWTSTAPLGTVFQVYVDRALAWHGTSRWVAITMPRARARIDIGAVGPGEASQDFSSMLPIAPRDRVDLKWLGGTFLAPAADDLSGFRVFGEPEPGAGIDMTKPLAEIQAYPGGAILDGFGLGGFGQGGFGRAASSYRWTSPPLASGVWSFAVVPFDAAGNQGEPVRTSVAVQAPPRAPGLYADGTRLKYAYDPTSRRATLSWNPSPA